MIRSFMTGLLWHVTSCFWNVPALLITCWLLHSSSGLSLKVTLQNLGTFHLFLLSSLTCYSATHLILFVIVDSVAVCLLLKNARTTCVLFTTTYPESIIPLLACSSCVKICWVNEWNLYVHCIYAFGIAVFWNCWVNEGLVGKLSCGTETLLINLTI